MIFETEQVNRLFSIDALIMLPIIMIFYHIILIKSKEWKCIAIFNIAGALYFLLEILMLTNGSRVVESSNLSIIFLTLFTLSWLDIGFFTSLAYININYVFNNIKIDRLYLIMLNFIFFVCLPIGSFNFGIFNQAVLTRRYVLYPALQLTLQLLALLIVLILLFFTGYRRLSLYLLCFGFVFGTSFQIRLYLAGIKQASLMSIPTLIIDTLTLVTMPVLAGALLLILFKKVDFFTFGDQPPLPKKIMNLRITLTAAKVLIDEVGLITTFYLVKDLVKQKKFKEPWKDLPKVSDWKDDDSRSLIGDAILLYRALLKVMDQQEAIRIIKRTILESAIMQLYSLVPIIKKEHALNISKRERENLLTNIVEKFPNTDWELIESTESSFAYRITKCRLVELVKDVGHPELSDAFCPGDERYFEKFQPDIEFTRPKAIGYGQECCDFIFKLKN